MLPQANSWEIVDRPIWPEQDSPPLAAPAPRVVAAAATPQPVTPAPTIAAKPLPPSRPTRVRLLVALTALGSRNRWWYEWPLTGARFRLRARDRHLPPEDGDRAVLHLFAPDAALTSIPRQDGDIAVLSRMHSAVGILHIRPAGGDPVTALPRPEALRAAGHETGIQLVFHGVAGNRRNPLAWIAVQVMRTHDLSEEDQVIPALGDTLLRVRDRFATLGVSATSLDRARALRTIASLAHIGDVRGNVRERWQHWHCGPIAQACFRLGGWPALPVAAGRRLLRHLLVTRTGAVVTISERCGPRGPESATMRVAASTVEQLELSIPPLRVLAAEGNVRLRRMNGCHAEGVAASLPLGTPR